MMYQLALDCSTSRGSVALADAAGPLLWQVEISAGRGHGGQLFSVLERALGEVRAMNGKIARIIVGLGPGSYSGVRQAVAAAAGLAAATGARLRGVPSVVGLPGEEDRYQVIGDARRGAFYYTAVQSGTCVVGPELLLDANVLAVRLAERNDWPVRVIDAPLPGGLVPHAVVAVPDAARLLTVPHEADRPPPLEPIYLRPVSITLPKPVLLAVS